MKKKILIIISILLVCLSVVFIIYKIDTINQTKEKIVDITKSLMEAISLEDYDKIRRYIKNIDGTELTDNQISNFLLNTELYRATLKEENSVFTYYANVNFFNTKKEE